MTPDKIYTCYNIEEGEKRQLWSTVLLSDVEQVGEYIRKDALLAFLNERRKGLSSGDSFVAGERKMLKEIIEKIESL